MIACPIGGNLDQAQINALIQNGIQAAMAGSKNDENQYRSQRACYRCGSPDHVKRNCPEEKKEASKGPAKGGPALIMKRGKLCCWCNHCGRYTASHDTEGHIGSKRETQKEAQVHFAAFPDPGAWTTAKIG